MPATTLNMGCSGCRGKLASGGHPGTLLEIIIYEVTKRSTVDCSACSERARQMNAWGWPGCWRNRDVIFQWLVEEARKRGHDINEATVKDLLIAAIKERFKV